MELSQYQIVLVDLNPTRGAEIRKTRPCLIVSPDELNRHLRTVVVAPMTTSVRNYPTRLTIIHQKRRGAAAIDQIRTIDKTRILKVLGALKADEVQRCKAIMRETFVD
ncbi:MAG: type II toxin-antitoxin system PemK/MazF family toxin [Schleiferiaceae bacterium]|jgi:mRNA interferase MazF|nr:type II toxin-antitoxin system PemK/MazF family toxin [Schleiferiaceae bacterium]MDR9442369.1 type II toxin-antitoxin system PemK/MazF family toxin [Schleiferiaceae bacterium]